MIRLADKVDMQRIRFLCAQGYVVTGHGYRYEYRAGYFHIERIA